MPHPPQIPLTPQTDERNFPRWEGEKAPPGRPGARYPKMLTRPTTREDRDDWVQKHRRIDQTTRQEYWEESPPRLHAPLPLMTTQDMVDEGLAELAGMPVIVQSAEEEQRVREFLGLEKPAPKPQTSAIPIRPMKIVASSQENPSSDWIEEAPPVKKRRGRPPKAKAIDVSN